ncbi:MAG: hypothetical protein ACWGQW_11335 [bacterium]
MANPKYELDQTSSIKMMLDNITTMSKEFISAAEQLSAELEQRQSFTPGISGVRPEDDPTSIGNILIQMGFISHNDLSRMVKEFKISKEEMLGEYFVRHTQLTVEQLEMALIRQQNMRGQAVIVSLSARTKKFGP